MRTSITGLGAGRIAGGASGVAVSPDGDHLYALSNKSAASDDDDALAVFARDLATGELTFVEAYFDDVGGVDGLGHASGLAVSPDGAHVYVTAAGADGLHVYLGAFDTLTTWLRNPGTGHLFEIETVDAPAGAINLSGLSLSPDGTSLYVTHSGLGLLVYDTACPTPCPFFADGFESGDLAGWSLFR